MADIFQEVDEEVRRERARQFWERHGNLVIAVAVVIVLGVGGWRGYQWWELKQSAEAGAAFNKAYIEAQYNAHVEAVNLFAAYAKSGDNAQLKALAAELLPTLQGHLDQVSRLRSS